MLKSTVSVRQAAAVITVCVLGFAARFASPQEDMHRGYYRYPAVHGDTIIFTSEGDLWSVDRRGGSARRITSNTGTEAMAVISPDGQSVAYRAEYEGPKEVYTMPVNGGLPQRRTWDGDAEPEGWTPDGRLMISTARYSTLPDPKLVLMDGHGNREIVPLASASQGAYSADRHTLFFTRWRKQFSATKRYQGGWSESLYRFDGHAEATGLTADWAGTSRNPMVWNGHVYFLSDRDGVMNLYSMDEHGHDIKQESRQHLFDIESASLSEGRIVYACGGDLWVHDVKTGQEAIVPVSLVSDFDQLREHWVKKPLDYLTGVHLSPDGSSAVFTARAKCLACRQKVDALLRLPVTRRCATAKPGFCRMARALLLSPRGVEKPNSGSMRPMARTRPSSGRMTRPCCAGREFPRRTDAGWRIVTRISSFGFTTS